eukprot:1156557-Pelagomonas_calceolata.AAC.8
MMGQARSQATPGMSMHRRAPPSLSHILMMALMAAGPAVANCFIHLCTEWTLHTVFLTRVEEPQGLEAKAFPFLFGHSSHYFTVVAVGAEPETPSRRYLCTPLIFSGAARACGGGIFAGQRAQSSRSLQRRSNHNALGFSGDWAVSPIIQSVCAILYGSIRKAVCVFETTWKCESGNKPSGSSCVCAYWRLRFGGTASGALSASDILQ